VKWNVNWGFSGVTPVAGNYDGDGITDLTVYHQTAGNWYVLESKTGVMKVYQWGGSSLVPVKP